jgi:hypothetical protein
MHTKFLSEYQQWSGNFKIHTQIQNKLSLVYSYVFSCNHKIYVQLMRITDSHFKVFFSYLNFVTSCRLRTNTLTHPCRDVRCTRFSSVTWKLLRDQEEVTRGNLGKCSLNITSFHFVPEKHVSFLQFLLRNVQFPCRNSRTDKSSFRSQDRMRH